MLTTTNPSASSASDNYVVNQQNLLQMNLQDNEFGQRIISGDERALHIALELAMLCLNQKAEAEMESNLKESNKKSQNTTECVPVPSSEHVAEIVGRQGSKIKGLRAKTNTYIKTPVRGEEPVFVVTGRKEDVLAAKVEILSAAQHFTQLRVQRKNIAGIGSESTSSTNGLTATASSQHVADSQISPGHTTKHVRVPYKFVGLVVGPRGATIKRIQQETNTYIITPGRENQPVFEVTGFPDNVENAKMQIEAHIALRTGGIVGSPNPRF